MPVVAAENLAREMFDGELTQIFSKTATLNGALALIKFIRNALW
jgi:hypothetical protein